MSILLVKKYQHLIKKKKKTKFTYLLILLWEKLLKNKQNQLKIKEKKQVDILKTAKPKELEAIQDKQDDNEKHLKYKEVFNELSNQRIGEIYNISKKFNFNNLTYHFKGSNTAPINFIDFRGPLHIYNEIKNDNISIEKIQEKNTLNPN